MTNDEKKLLRWYIKEGWTFDEIREEVACSDATIRRYIKIFRKT